MPKKATKTAKAKRTSSGKSRPSESAAQAVAARSSLSEILLRSINAANNVEHRTKPPGHFKLEITQNAQHQKYKEINAAGEKEKTERQRILIDVHFSIAARNAKEDAEPALQIDIKYRLNYAVKPGRTFSESQLASFGALNALAAVWPYMTELASTTSLKMGFPGIRIPPQAAGQIEMQRQP